MIKNEVQEQRMREYFIQATREILKGEGLKGVSVRNIAQKAGYSYATLYNYFHDVKQLVFECVVDFQKEGESYILEQVKDHAPGKSRIKGISLAYIRYFVEYPGIFELFFIEKSYDMGSGEKVHQLIYSWLERLCEPDWVILNSELREKQLNLLITGLLLFYLHRRIPADYAHFMRLAGEQIDFVLG